MKNEKRGSPVLSAGEWAGSVVVRCTSLIGVGGLHALSIAYVYLKIGSGIGRAGPMAR